MVTPIPAELEKLKHILPSIPFPTSLFITTEDQTQSENCNDLEFTSDSSSFCSARVLHTENELKHWELNDRIYEKLSSILLLKEASTEQLSSILVVNANPHSQIRHHLCGSHFILHDALKGPNLIEQDPVEYLPSLNRDKFKTVVVSGQLSEKLRNWIEDESSSIQRIVYFVKDINKVIWDADHMNKFLMKSLTVFDVDKNGMDVWCVSERYRIR